MMSPMIYSLSVNGIGNIYTIHKVPSKGKGGMLIEEEHKVLFPPSTNKQGNAMQGQGQGRFQIQCGKYLRISIWLGGDIQTARTP